MTITTTTTRVSYPGAGSVGPYAIPFRFFTAADLLVTKRTASGAESTLGNGADFSVTGALDLVGTLTLTNALAAGETLVIRRAPALTQPTSLRNQAAYFPGTIEDTFDRLLMQVQELRDELDRAARVTETRSVQPRLKPEANKALFWDATGTQLENRTPDSSAVAVPGAGRTVATQTAYLANNAYEFNILDFGAVGDGATDARAAIAAADVACQAAYGVHGGSIVVVPAGFFRIASNLTIHSQLRFSGGPCGRLQLDAAVTLDLDRCPIAPPVCIFSLGAGALVRPTGGAFPLSPAICCYPDWWGGSGNVAPYDTAAVQAAFDTSWPVRFAKNYYVTTVNIDNGDDDIDFGHFRLVGSSTTPNTDAILQIQSYKSELRNIHVDGNWNLNYKCGVRIFGDAQHTNPGFNKIYGLTIDNAILAFVLGGQIGDTPYNCPLSETTIYGFLVRGVQRCVYMNQPNGKISFVGGHAVVQKNEWDAQSPGTFSYANSWAVRNEPASGGGTIGGGEISWIGGSIENNESGLGVGIRGAQMHISRAVWEVAGTNTIEGDQVVIDDNLNSAVGAFAVNVPLFTIAAGATGRLMLRAVRSTRTVSGGSSYLVDGILAPTFLVVIESCDFQGFLGTLINQYTPLVHGCRVKFVGPTRFKNFAGSVDVEITGDDRQSILQGFDATGATFPAVTLDQAAKGGWTFATGGGAGNKFGQSVDIPAASALPASIELDSVAGQTAQMTTPTGTNGFLVSAFKIALARFWFKLTANGSGTRVTVLWYKRDGSAASTASSDILNVATSVTLGLTLNTWYRITQFVQAPADAQFAALQVYGDNGTIMRVADFRMD